MNSPTVKRQLERDPNISPIERREMLLLLGKRLGTAVVGAAVLGAGEALAQKPEGSAGTKGKRRYGMVIDTRRYVGCKACVIACKAENKTPPGVYYTVVFDPVIEPRIDDKPVFMTKPCCRCGHPPCVDVCPVSATFKREQDGTVVVDDDRCIGRRYCMTACPYSARWFDFDENYAPVEEKTFYASVPSPEYRQFRHRIKGLSPVGNVRKCHFCLHLQDKNGEYNREEGRWPACAKTCTGHAIHFGGLLDPGSTVHRLLRERVAVRLKEELGTEPSVFFLL